MGNPEADVEGAVVLGVHQRGGWAAKMIDKGQRGAPDRECRFPGPRIIYIETKAPGGRLKSWQERYHDQLRAMGFVVLTLWSAEQVEQFFDRYDKGELK